MIFAMSANVFAVDTWSHIWYASDDVTTVEYYATIDTTRTLGSIDSLDNQGEVSVNADIYYIHTEEGRGSTHRYDAGVYYAGVYYSCSPDVSMESATYSFYAYVGSTGNEFTENGVSLVP